MHNIPTMVSLIAAVELAAAITCSPQDTFDVICRALNLQVFNVIQEPEVPQGSWMVEQEGHA